MTEHEDQITAEAEEIRTNRRQLRVLTQSAVRAFRKCPRLYEQTYVQLYRSTTTADPLKYGTFWHDIREAWWKAPPGDTRLEVALQKLADLRDRKLDTNDEPLDEFTLAKLIVMLRGYHERWVSLVDSVEVLGVEVPFEIPLVNPRTSRESRTYNVQGKLDGVLRDAEGRIWVVEEKTAAEALEPESAYWRRLEVDPQCSLYYIAVKQLYGEEPAGIKYFVNVKTQKRPLKKTKEIKYRKSDGLPNAGQRLEDETASEFAVRMAEAVAASPDKFYQMVEVARLERDLRESQVDVWDTAQAIRQAELSGTWLRNPDSCIHPFGGACSFLPVCTHRASLEDPLLYRKADTAHEELVEQKEV